MGIVNSPADSLSNALFGETRQAVLRLLFGHPDERFYQLQIIRALGLGSGSVQRELSRLTNVGILQRTVEGHQTYYQANSSCPIFEELRGLTRKTVGAPAVIHEALGPVAPRILSAFIYGSIARGTEMKASDIDLMVISDGVTVKELSKSLSRAERELQREINPTLYTPREFYRRLIEGHHFVATVMNEPKVFIIGTAHELKRLVKKRSTHEA